jgi:hypothetical protein
VAVRKTTSVSVSIGGFWITYVSQFVEDLLGFSVLPDSFRPLIQHMVCWRQSGQSHSKVRICRQLISEAKPQPTAKFPQITAAAFLVMSLLEFLAILVGRRISLRREENPNGTPIKRALECINRRDRMVLHIVRLTDHSHISETCYSSVIKSEPGCRRCHVMLYSKLFHRLVEETLNVRAGQRLALEEWKLAKKDVISDFRGWTPLLIHVLKQSAFQNKHSQQTSVFCELTFAERERNRRETLQTSFPEIEGFLIVSMAF